MTTRSRFVVAAIVSFALHGLVLSRTWVPFPHAPAPPQTLEARLVPRPPAIPPVVTKPRQPAPRRTAPVPKARTVSAASPLALPEPQPEPVPDPEPAATGTVEEPVPEPPEQVALAAETSAAPASSLPHRGRITYTLLYGEERSYVGKAVQTWEVEDGVYRISSEAETGGIVELFRPQRLRYLSEGHVTRDGLRPDAFLMSRTRRGRHEAAQARFDWRNNLLTYGLAQDQKTVRLSGDAQDFMSFVYQFVVAPPSPGRFEVPITTGSRFEVYEVEVASESFIETPIGTLRALSIRQIPRPGTESIQIWLAADYRYLPVRIRHFDRDGQFSGEQVVSEIRISEE